MPNTQKQQMNVTITKFIASRRRSVRSAESRRSTRVSALHIRIICRPTARQSSRVRRSACPASVYRNRYLLQPCRATPCRTASTGRNTAAKTGRATSIAIKNANVSAAAGRSMLKLSARFWEMLPSHRLTRHWESNAPPSVPAPNSRAMPASSGSAARRLPPRPLPRLRPNHSASSAHTPITGQNSRLNALYRRCIWLEVP